MLVRFQALSMLLIFINFMMSRNLRENASLDKILKGGGYKDNNDVHTSRVLMLHSVPLLGTLALSLFSLSNAAIGPVADMVIVNKEVSPDGFPRP